jgi:hypothetical protein
MCARRQINIRKLNPVTVSEDSDKSINNCRLLDTSAVRENRELLCTEVGSLKSSNSPLPAHLNLAPWRPIVVFAESLDWRERQRDVKRKMQKP